MKTKKLKKQQNTFLQNAQNLAHKEGENRRLFFEGRNNFYYITPEDIGRQQTGIKTVERVISSFKNRHTEQTNKTRHAAKCCRLV